MPDYGRYFVEGGTYFFTVVTADWIPLFNDPWARYFLGQSIRQERDKRPFETLAIILLPDHLHAIWALPPEFGGSETSVSPGYAAQRRRGVWQARFIEHTIRDEDDLYVHADYLHFNPVKHGLARCPKDWLWSSFHIFVQKGHYEAD